MEFLTAFELLAMLTRLDFDTSLIDVVRLHIFVVVHLVLAVVRVLIDVVMLIVED